MSCILSALTLFSSYNWHQLLFVVFSNSMIWPLSNDNVSTNLVVRSTGNSWILVIIFAISKIDPGTLCELGGVTGVLKSGFGNLYFNLAKKMCFCVLVALLPD